MRQAGTLSDEATAQRFADFLLTEGIANRIDPSDGKWNVWIYDDDDLKRGRELLDEFRANPDEAKYHQATRKAEEMRAARPRPSANKKNARWISERSGANSKVDSVLPPHSL